VATLPEIAAAHQKRLVAVSDEASRQTSLLWARIGSGSLEAGWSAIAPEVERVVTAAQVSAAALSTSYVGSALRAQNGGVEAARVVPQAFGGVTREGRAVAPELYTAVTTTKSLIGRGVGVGQAFRAGAAYMAVMAATLVRDAGRSADDTLATGRGSQFSVRVLHPGACSRCAILAGIKGWRVDFDRHPGCRCTSMPLFDDEFPEGFFRSSEDYFESLSEAEQDRVFTKSGAEAIRLGADPAKVVNARRGMYTQAKKHPDGTFGPSRLKQIQIGVSADGSPLMVYATVEGTTARGVFGRAQNDLTKNGMDRYRRSRTLRLMPEQIMSMASTPERARELLQRYGYLY
jgi:hypothetical protein